MKITDESTIREYYGLRKQIENYNKDMKTVIQHPNYCLPYLQDGRLVKVKYEDIIYGWGVVVGFRERRRNRDEKTQEVSFSPQGSFIVDILLMVADTSSTATRTHQNMPSGIRPPAPGEKGQMQIVPCMLTCIDAIAYVRVHLPQDLRTSDERNGIKKALDEVKRRFPDGVPLLDPIENMGITDASFKKLLRVSARHKKSCSILTADRKLKYSNLAYCQIHYTTRHDFQNYTTSTRKRSNFTTNRRQSRGRSQMPKL